MERAVVRLPDSDEVYSEWRRLVTSHGVLGKTAHDARLVATMKIDGVRHILTFDTEDFARYPGIQPLHPANVF